MTAEELKQWCINQGFEENEREPQIYDKEWWQIWILPTWFRVVYRNRVPIYNGEYLDLHTFKAIMEGNRFKVWRFEDWLLEQGWEVYRPNAICAKDDSREIKFEDAEGNPDESQIPQSEKEAIALFKKLEIPLKTEEGE